MGPCRMTGVPLEVDTRVSAVLYGTVSRGPILGSPGNSNVACLVMQNRNLEYGERRCGFTKHQRTKRVWRGGAHRRRGRGCSTRRLTAPPSPSGSRPPCTASLVTSSLLGPVDSSFRDLSRRLKFTVRRHKFNKESPSRASVEMPSTRKPSTPVRGGRRAQRPWSRGHGGVLSCAACCRARHASVRLCTRHLRTSYLITTDRRLPCTGSLVPCTTPASFYARAIYQRAIYGRTRTHLRLRLWD